ncbi:hypothetical protein EDD37DRAFT_411461 [Exophiala viscosa]|uniref:uncharacterized protein n=1 Tax=Exophiala viscosa TaxID=2486360 RepID=UPI0021917721|nr:hypothetical protein EDD37DRAFT_411461 [Exophiala viscosa]
MLVNTRVRVKQYKTKLSDWGFKHNLKTTDAAHILRLLNQAKTEGLPEVVMWAFQPKTREDIANFIRRQSTLNDEAHLLSKISDEDKTPHYIKLAGIDVLSSPTNNIPEEETLDYVSPRDTHPIPNDDVVSAGPSSIRLPLQHEQCFSAFGEHEEPELLWTISDSQDGKASKQDPYTDFSGDAVVFTSLSSEPTRARPESGKYSWPTFESTSPVVHGTQWTTRPMTRTRMRNTSTLFNIGTYNTETAPLSKQVAPGQSRSSLSDRSAQIEVEFTIKCICGSPDDDGSTVYCPSCDTWQHIGCYYYGKEVPEEHICTDCLPQDLDAEKATERQRARRKTNRA